MIIDIFIYNNSLKKIYLVELHYSYWQNNLEDKLYIDEDRANTPTWFIEVGQVYVRIKLLIGSIRFVHLEL